MSNYGEGQERQTETGLQHLQGGEIKIGLKKQHEKGHVKWHVKYYDCHAAQIVVNELVFKLLCSYRQED